MDPRRFREQAEQLANGSTAVDGRTAISRAYYAVFNVADQFLARMHITRPKLDQHKALQTRFLGSRDAEIIKIGSDLGDFHQDRIDADYHMDRTEPEKQANALAAVEKAKRMIAILDGCPIHSARWNDIKSAIEKVRI